MLVLTTFRGPRPLGMVGCHNDGNKLNNRADNLRWDTHGGNEADKVRHGTLLLGTRNPNAVLDPDKIRDIRNRLSAGRESMSKLSREYGVSVMTIGRIRDRKAWKHVSDDLPAAAVQAAVRLAHTDSRVTREAA